MDVLTEAARVGRLRAGDHAAFDAVYDEYRTRLYTFLAGLSRSREVADDLLDELWLRLVRHAPRLRPDTRIGAWLFTVARNLYLSYLRNRTWDESLDASEIALWPGSPAEASPFEALASSELELRIHRGIASLPARYREVLLLVGVEGFSQAEAAVICQVSPEALRQRLSRARALLAREVDRLGEAPSVAWQEVLS